MRCVPTAMKPMPPKRKPHTDQLPLAWQPQVGDRVTLGTEIIYTVTRASQNGSDVDLQTPGTNLYRYRVPIGDLKPVDAVRQPSSAPSERAKPSINMEEVRERIANAQQSSVDQFSGDIAILKKYLKSKGIEAAALEELDSLCEDMEKRWSAAVEVIKEMLEE
jgi:hypothetical protein